MKKLDTKNINLYNSLQLNDDNADAHLWRYDLDRYAITVNWLDQPIFAFESFEFSALLNTLESSITDFVLVRSQCLLCEDDHEYTELRFITENGDAYNFDCGGNVSSIKELALSYVDQKPAASPCELWGLPVIDPYTRMLISVGMVEQLQPFITPTSIRDIADRLWTELSHHVPVPTTKGATEIQSEFGVFAALELLCGRIVLMTVSEQNEASQRPLKKQPSNDHNYFTDAP